MIIAHYTNSALPDDIINEIHKKLMILNLKYLFLPICINNNHWSIVITSMKTNLDV